MKVIVKGTVIDLDHIENYYLLPESNAICFVARRDITDHRKPIPLAFRSREAMLEAFNRMKSAAAMNAASVSISDLHCEWVRTSETSPNTKEPSTSKEKSHDSNHQLRDDRPGSI